MEQSLGCTILSSHDKYLHHFTCVFSPCCPSHSSSPSPLRAHLPHLSGAFVEHGFSDNDLESGATDIKNGWFRDSARDLLGTPKIVRTRSNYLGEHADGEERTSVATKDVWVNQAQYILQRNSTWEQRKRAIEDVVVSCDEPAVALGRAQKNLALVDYNTILRRFATLRQWHELHLAFEWMKHNNKLTPPCFTTFISSMGKAGFPYRALQTFENQSDPEVRVNVIVCNSLFKALVFNGKVDAAFALFKQLKLEGLVPNFDTFKSLIAGCVKHRGAYAKADSFLQEMVAMGMQPDSVIFKLLLNVCASCGLEEEAQALLEKMEEIGIARNRYHYVSLLHLYAEIKKPDEAEKVYSEIQQRHVPLDKVILFMLLKVYTNSGLLEKARNCFDEMEMLGFPPQETSYCLMMDAYVKDGKVSEAHNLLNEMKAKRMEPGCYSYCIMVSAYANMGNIDAVESLVAELDSLPRESLDVVLFNNLLRAYCELDIMEGILKIMKKMDEEHVAPDRGTFNILITFFCKEELFDLARQTLQDLLDKRLRPNLNSYAPIILGLLRTENSDKALVVYNEMKTFNIAVSASLIEAMIEVLCKSKRVEEAISLLKEVKDTDLTLQSTFLESLFISTGTNTELVVDIFEALDETNLKEVNFDAVLMSYEQQGCLDAVPKMLGCMKEHGFHASKEFLDHFWDKRDKGYASKDMSLPHSR